MRRRMLMAVLGVTLANLPLPGVAADDDSPDVHFYTKAAEGNLAEVDLGMATHQHSTTAGVVQFGDMMVKDHTAANARLREVAVMNHVVLRERRRPGRPALCHGNPAHAGVPPRRSDRHAHRALNGGVRCRDQSRRVKRLRLASRSGD